MASRKRKNSHLNDLNNLTHTEPRTTFKKDRTETIRGYFSWKEVDCVLIKTIARRDLRPISVRVRILRKRSSYRRFNLLIRAQIRIGTLKQSHNTQMYKKTLQHYKQVQRQSSFYSVLYRRCTWCSSAKRENFNHFSFSHFYYVTQIVRMSLVSLINNTARKSLENQRSNANSIMTKT